MNILYIGDVMGELGVALVERELPKLHAKHKLDFVVAQAENVTDGKSMSREDMERLQRAGVDFFTGGNHTPSRTDIHELLRDELQPVIGPANMLGCPGKGWQIAQTPHGNVLVVSLLGSTVGREIPAHNPLKTVDTILHANLNTDIAAIVVNFHGDYSSEKMIIGHYLDGRASMVVGDHWHVPTADAGILPKGTAHITDVGMCGSLDSSLGVTFDSVIPRWRDNVQTKNTLETTGRLQFNALLCTVNTASARATSCEQIRLVFDA